MAEGTPCEPRECICECMQKQRLTAMEEKLDTLSTIVSGNGNPTKGLVMQNAKLWDWMVQCRWAISIIFVSILGIMASSYKTYNTHQNNKQLQEHIQKMDVLINKFIILAETPK